MFSFLSPVSLWLGALLAIPLVIHFLGRQRLRKEPFPSLLLLQEQFAKSMHRHRLKNLLLLVIRTLLILCLLLALANPALETRSAGAARFLTAWGQNPDQAGATMMPDAAAANRPVFYNADGSMRSLGEIREFFRAKLDQDGGPGMMPGVPAPTPGWRMQMASASGASSGGRPPLPMMDIQPMPKKLSMDFAASAYRRLASLGGGA